MTYPVQTGRTLIPQPESPPPRGLALPARSIRAPEISIGMIGDLQSWVNVRHDSQYLILIEIARRWQLIHASSIKSARRDTYRQELLTIKSSVTQFLGDKMVWLELENHP